MGNNQNKLKAKVSKETLPILDEIDKAGNIETIENVIMYVDNKSQQVNDDDVKKMIEACNNLMPKVVKKWNDSIKTYPVVEFGSGPKPLPLNDWQFHIVDNDPNGVDDALAYHTVEGDVIDGYILAKTILDNGGTVLYGGDNNKNQETVASALFHELVEALGDPECNSWWKNDSNKIFDTTGNEITIETQDSTGKIINVIPSFVAAELCDPVQGNVVIITLKDGTKVALSDFILPAWSKPKSKRPYNYMNTLKKPFTVDTGGYVVCKHGSDDNSEQGQGFGMMMPEWLRDMKKKSGRITNRKGN